jgi:hypothetical protein
MAAILEARAFRKAETDRYMRSILLAYETKLLSNYLFS